MKRNTIPAPVLEAIEAQERQDTKLESQGAEFLVLGSLLVQGILCYKSYVNFPGYDLLAVAPRRKRLDRIARIQVKSRWATDYDKSFPIKSFECDFVVHVALNRGIRFRKPKTRSKHPDVRDPEFYVFPVNVVKRARNVKSKWGKVTITRIRDYEQYKSNWALIIDFLNK